jgi:D-alanyl-D-alanine carboxypeptidase/D-alanyl-D-alanine-endopeptidase (penicillin-binding protein 4)
MSSSSTRALACAVLFLAGPACATRTAGPAHRTTAGPPASPAAVLARRLDDIFTRTPADRVLWGVMIRDTASGAVVYQRHADRLLHPASNMKLLTLAAAVERLGWDFRFETTVRSTTPVDSDGTVRGDLVVIGSGDPTISRRHGGAETLAQWADRIRAQGIRRIEGRVIGDGSAFGPTAFGEGWQWDDLPYSYAAPVSALTYNENTAELRVAAGRSAGARAEVTVVDPAAQVLVVNEVRTVGADSARRLSIRRGDDGRIWIEGEIPLGYQPVRVYAAIPDPPAYFARALRDALVARGVVVGGAARSAASDPPGPFAPDAPVLLRHRSPALREMAVTLMKVSQNLYAELLLRALGERPDDPAAGPAALTAQLAAWGAGPGTVVVGDGSGLSRYDLASAATVDMALGRMWAAGGRDAWVATLPVAGVDGTLERRMKGTPAEGRVHAKTGTIAYVRALSGYVRTAGDGWMQFAILANNFAGNVTTADVDRIAEQAVTLLASSPAAAGTR